MNFKSFFKRNRKEEEKKVSFMPKEATREEQKVCQLFEKERTKLIQSAKKKEVLISNQSVVPSGCKNYLGYLYDRPQKSSKIPEECVICLEVLNCLIHR